MRIEESAARSILLLGFDTDEAAQLAGMLGDEIEVSAAAGEDEALRGLGAGVVLCLGPGLSGREAAAFLARAVDKGGRFVVLAAGGEPELFQDFVDADALFFLARRPPPLAEVAA